MMSKWWLILVASAVPLSVSLTGCGDDQTPRTLEETEEGQFDRIAEEIAAQEEAAGEEP